MMTARRFVGSCWCAVLAPGGVLLALFVCAVLFLVPGSYSHASEQVQIAEAVPSDVVLYFHCQVPQGAEWAKRFGKLRAALSSPTFLDQYWKRYGDKSADKKALAEELAYWRRILSRTPVWKLFEKEFAFAVRREGKSREWVAAFKVASQDRDVLLNDFRRILLALSGLVPNVEAVVSTRKGIPVTVLYSDEGEAFCTGGIGDAIVVTSNAGLLRQTLQLLGRESSDLPFVHGVLRREIRKEILAQTGRAAEVTRTAEDGRVVELFVQPTKLFHDVRLAGAWDDFAFSGAFRGPTFSGGFRSTFGKPKGAAGRLLRRTFLERPELDGLQSWLPSNAAGYEVSSGWDPVGVYTLLTQVGEAFDREDLDELLDGDPRWRVLSLMTGRWVMARLAEGWGSVIELNDESKDKGRDRLLDGIKTVLASWNLRWRPRASKSKGVWHVVESQSEDRALFHVGVVETRLIIASSLAVAEILLSGEKSDALDFSGSPWADRRKSHYRIAQGEYPSVLSQGTALSLLLLSHRLSSGEPAEYVVGAVAGWLGEALFQWEIGATQKSYTIRNENQIHGVVELQLKR